MCQFKSGIILKNRIVLTPEGNESHSDLLETLNIDDNSVNMMKKFVRAELIPPYGNKAKDINLWKFNVDQDFVPDWFENDKKKYEQDFRDAVKDYLIGKFVVLCGLPWNIIKEDNGCTYYLLDCILKESQFGTNNNYNQSLIKEKLNSSELAQQLKSKFGDRLIPIEMNLLSLDGLDDYGNTEGEILSIPTLDLYRECRKYITNIHETWWLSTPHSTPSGYSCGYVGYVRSDGNVDWFWCDDCRGVRPFFVLKS